MPRRGGKGWRVGSRHLSTMDIPAINDGRVSESPQTAGIIAPGVGQTVAAIFWSWRKVRAPQDRVPGNAWEARAYGKCHRKHTAKALQGAGKGEKVR